MTTQTFELFGKLITYDPDRNYGAVTSKGQYGKLLVDRTFQRFAGLGSPENALAALAVKIGSYRGWLTLQAITETGILEVTGSSSGDLLDPKQKKAVENSIDLLVMVEQTLKS